MPGNWDAEPQPFMGGLISEQAAQHVYDAGSVWRRWGTYAVGATSGESRNVTADPGIIELTGAANVPDEEVLGRCLAYGVMTVLMRRFVWRTTPALDCRVG